MASRAMKPCSKPGCPGITKERYCEEHKALANAQPRVKDKAKARDYDKQRGTAASRGYDAKWRAYREDYLRVNKVCRICGGKATVVDHIIPHKGNKGLFWTRFNHQALCKSCHDRKTATQDGGFGNNKQE